MSVNTGNICGPAHSTKELEEGLGDPLGYGHSF